MPPASFTDLGVSPKFAAALRTAGISIPTPIQARSIPALLAGRDLLGQAPTGSGKTLAFALPILARCDKNRTGVQALVLVPTRELASQVANVIRQLVRDEIGLILLHGGKSLVPERQALARGVQIVVGTPGRTLDHLRQGSLDLSQLRVLVLDEADEMLDRGFAPDVERIIARTPDTRQTMLFSATVPEWVSTTAARHLRNPLSVQLEAGQDAPAPDIDHVVYELEPGVKFEALTNLLDRRSSSILVFGRTKHGVKKLAKQLAARGYPVGALQGNLAQNARDRAIAAFRSGELPILCATNVAARGLDIEGIGQVINYELPESAELFTHRVGRTGRMGRKGEAITFVTPDDVPKLRQIEKRLGRPLTRGPQLPAARMPAVPRPATLQKTAGGSPPNLQKPGGASRPGRLARRYR